MRPRRLAIVAGLIIAAVFVVAAPSVIAGAIDLRRGRAEAALAANALRASDAAGARAGLQAARVRFARAYNHLHSPWTRAVRAIPLAGRQLVAAADIASSGESLAAAGVEASDAFTVIHGWHVRNGTIPLQSLHSAAIILRKAIPEARAAADAIDRGPTSWLMPPVRGAHKEASHTVHRALDAMQRGSIGLDAAPALLGAKGARRYLIFESNLSELRGTGGLYGYFAVVDANGGKLKLVRTGRPGRDLPKLDAARLRVPQWFHDAYDRYKSLEVWQNLNMSPDFPVVANIAAQAVPAIDGVVQIDAYGLAALLTMTGPVSVEGWPEPVSTSNIAGITEHDMYIRYVDIAQRDAFGERVIRSVFEKFLSSNLKLGIGALDQLGRAVSGGHIEVYSSKPDEEQKMKELGIDGSVADAHTIGVFNINAGQNKVDWFLHRRMSTKRVRAVDGRPAIELTIDLANDAPLNGKADYIMGLQGGPVSPGTNKTILGIVHPVGTDLVDASIDGKPVVFYTDHDGELLVGHLPLSIGPQGHARIVVTLAWRRDAVDDADSLRVVLQPIATAN